MHYGNYRFECRFDSDAQLPPYKGSTFRGVFGRALKQVVCALKRQTCPDCLLKNQCLYIAVFEPHLAGAAAGSAVKNALPHPFVIEPALTEQTFYPQGAALDFNLLLFGAVNARLPYFIYAIDRMGKIGIGRKIDGSRGIYTLDTVKSDGSTIYTAADQKLSQTQTARSLGLKDSLQTNQIKAVKIKFHTPLRLKHNNRLTPELPFHVLVRAMLRRTATLLNHFDGAEPTLDYTGMVQRAEAVNVKDQDLIWEDWQRYSRRQEQRMSMGGIKGSIIYEGLLDEFLPLIEFCAKVHLGKQTTFGLGRFAVEAA